MASWPLRDQNIVQFAERGGGGGGGEGGERRRGVCVRWIREWRDKFPEEDEEGTGTGLGVEGRGTWKEETRSILDQDWPLSTTLTQPSRLSVVDEHRPLFTDMTLCYVIATPAMKLTLSTGTGLLKNRKVRGLNCSVGRVFGSLSYMMQRYRFNPPVEGIFPLELTWFLTPFPQNSFGWQCKLWSSLCTHAFHCIPVTIQCTSVWMVMSIIWEQTFTDMVLGWLSEYVYAVLAPQSKKLSYVFSALAAKGKWTALLWLCLKQSLMLICVRANAIWFRMSLFAFNVYNVPYFFRRWASIKLTWLKRCQAFSFFFQTYQHS